MRNSDSPSRMRDQVIFGSLSDFTSVTKIYSMPFLLYEYVFVLSTSV